VQGVLNGFQNKQILTVLKVNFLDLPLTLRILKTKLSQIEKLNIYEIS